jgi:hypothetical protein
MRVGLWFCLPYPLTHTRIHTNVAGASATPAPARNPLSLKIIVSLIAIAPHALHIPRLPATVFPVVMPVLHRVRMLSLERGVVHVLIHAMHAGSARTRHHATMTASAPATTASEGFAARVDGAQKCRGRDGINKNGLHAHRDCPNDDTIISCDPKIVRIERSWQITKPRLVKLTPCFGVCAVPALE